MFNQIIEWGCEECDETFSENYAICPQCGDTLSDLSNRVASGYVIQFNGKDKDGSIRDIHEVTIQEGDDHLGLHIEGFIEDENIATIEVMIAPSDKLFVSGDTTPVSNITETVSEKLPGRKD